jgi:hypothetical protein
MFLDGLAMMEKKQRGGVRPNSGRKPTGRKRQQYYVTDEEHEQIKKLIERLRKGQS